MNASAAARPGEDDGRGDGRYRRADSWSMARRDEQQRWQEESQEREKRQEEEDERRRMRQCKIITLEGMLDTHEKRLVQLELWQLELDKLEDQGGPQQTEDNRYRGTRDERRKRAKDMAEDHRGIVKQKKEFIWLIMWDLRGLKKDASDDAVDDAMHEATAYHAMHTIDEATEYQ